MVFKHYKTKFILNNLIKQYHNSKIIKRKEVDYIYLNKFVLIVYKHWESSGSKTYKVEGFCFKIKKKKYETILFMKSKEKNTIVTMGFILESPNILKISIKNAKK